MHRLRRAAVAAALLSAAPLAAAPTPVTITPPSGARFLAGQRFDLRVEGAGTGPFSATLTLDGSPVAFTSGAPGLATDGITLPGFGGFDVRGYSSTAAGPHELRATFTDATGTVSATSRFEIVPVRRRTRGVKNVVILLGDGMGLAHRTAARIVRYGVTDGQPNGWLEMDRLPGTGLVSTHSLNSVVTDSAPGMSCYTTGSHARNGQEGVYPARVVSPFFYPRVEYLSEMLHRLKGTALGLVTTADVEDATPAANAVHTGERDAGTGICDRYFDEADDAFTGKFGTGLTVLMGGGRRWFVPADEDHPYSSREVGSAAPPLPADLVTAWALPGAGSANAQRNLLSDFEGHGFQYVDTAATLKAATLPKPPDKLLGLFAWGNMNVALDKIAKRRGVAPPGSTTFAVDDFHAPDQPMLDEMTEAALAVLARHREGFVLLVEGAQIDKQSHQMDADRVIDEVLEFDRAVGVARRFAETRGDTLVVVLADHETAGFSLIGALTGGIEAEHELGSDSDVVDPARTPARQKIVGVYDGAAFPHYTIDPTDGYPETLNVDGKLLVGFGAGGDRFETWLTPPRPVIESLLPRALKSELGDAGYASLPFLRTDSNSTGFFIRGQAVGHDRAVHTATDVPLSAYSRDNAWQRFVGVQTNTDVFFKLMKAALGE